MEVSLTSRSTSCLVGRRVGYTTKAQTTDVAATSHRTQAETLDVPAIALTAEKTKIVTRLGVRVSLFERVS